MTEGQALIRRGIWIAASLAVLVIGVGLWAEQLEGPQKTSYIRMLRFPALGAIYGVWLVLKGLWVRRGERKAERFFSALIAQKVATDPAYKMVFGQEDEPRLLPSTTTTPENTAKVRFAHLEELRERGLVTEAEYTQKRKQILDEL